MIRGEATKTGWRKAKKIVPQRSILQTVLGLARELLQLAGIAPNADRSQVAQTNPRTRAGAAQIQTGLKNMADRSARSGVKTTLPASGAPGISDFSAVIDNSAIRAQKKIQSGAASAPPAALSDQRRVAPPVNPSDPRDRQTLPPAPSAAIHESKPIAAPPNWQSPPSRTITPAPRPLQYKPTIHAVPIIDPKPILDVPNPNPDDYAENRDGPAQGM